MIPAALHLTVVHQLRVLCTIKIILCLCVLRIICQRYYCYYLLVIMLHPHPAPSFPSLPLAFFRFLFENFSMMPYLRCVHVSFHRVLLSLFCS